MSTIEYNSLLFEISERIDELNALQRLVFICRGKLTQSGSGNVHDGLSLLQELEEHGYLGIDRLKLMKELLKSVKEWSLIGRVKKFENKRKEYKGLLGKIICALDELNDMERLITLCRGNIREGNIGNIVDVRSLFEELENQETLGFDCLDVVKVILAETGKTDLFKEVEEFEERRDHEDEFEAKKEQRAAHMSSVKSTLMGVVNMKTVFKLFAGGLVIVSATEVLSGWSSYDQLVAVVQSCVLPAGTSLVQITDGCVCLTVQAESLSALTNLWKLYQDGTLQKRLYDFFVTEVRELAEGEDVEVNVTIDEGEYQKACIELIPGVQGGATIDYVERRRRNSDSAVYFNAKELPPSRLKCLETEVKYLHNGIALLEDKKENLGSHPFERNEIAPTGSPDKKFEDKAFDFEKRGRRNSDSAVYLKANEEPPILRLQRDEAELRQKIIGLEQKINRMRIGTFVEAPNVKQEERPGRRTRRNSDSFLCVKPNENEIGLMKPMEETEGKWGEEKKMLELRIVELEETLKAERTRDLDQDEILERPRERRRRNSDSNLYYKAREEEVEQTDNQPERALEGGVQLDIEKRLLVEDYLQNIHETHSMTTETSDSGIRTLGTTAEIEMQDIPGDDHKLCWKDLSREVIEKLEGRLLKDQTAFKQICQSFGIDRPLFYPREGTLSGILRMFPDTPVKLFKEVFEALQLYDLIDLLEEGKPRATRSLRLALRSQEIEKLRNPDDRPISSHSSVAVLIIDFGETFDTEGIEKFFKGLNTKSEVTVMRCRNVIEAVRSFSRSLEKIKEEIKREMNKLSPTYSEVIQSWISNQGKYSLVAVFFIFDRPNGWFYRAGNSFVESVKERLVTAFPTKVKLIIHSSSHQPHSWPHKELVEVFVPFDGDVFLPLMLEIFIKRWQTMDLLSMMRELERSLGEEYSGIDSSFRRGFKEFIIKENLSCLVRFIMHKEPTN